MKERHFVESQYVFFDSAEECAEAVEPIFEKQRWRWEGVGIPNRQQILARLMELERSAKERPTNRYFSGGRLVYDSGRFGYEWPRHTGFATPDPPELHHECIPANQPCPICLYHWNETVLPGETHNRNCLHADQQPQPPQPEAPEQILPCPWCGATSDGEDEWGSLITHKTDCYWRNNKGNPIGCIRVNNSERVLWNRRADIAADEDERVKAAREDERDVIRHIIAAYLPRRTDSDVLIADRIDAEITARSESTGE